MADLAAFDFSLKADVSPVSDGKGKNKLRVSSLKLFNWNVKQLFVYLVAEYATEKNVSLFPHITPSFFPFSARQPSGHLGSDSPQKHSCRYRWENRHSQVSFDGRWNLPQVSVSLPLYRPWMLYLGTTRTWLSCFVTTSFPMLDIFDWLRPRDRSKLRCPSHTPLESLPEKRNHSWIEPLLPRLKHRIFLVIIVFII